MWAMSTLMAFLGGFLGWYSRFRKNKSRVFNAFEFFAECFCGVIVGHITHIICLALGQDPGYCLACAACGGALSHRALGWLNDYAEKFVNGRLK